jgi:hypothetical protein
METRILEPMNKHKFHHKIVILQAYNINHFVMKFSKAFLAIEYFEKSNIISKVSLGSQTIYSDFTLDVTIIYSTFFSR